MLTIFLRRAGSAFVAGAVFSAHGVVNFIAKKMALTRRNSRRIANRRSLGYENAMHRLRRKHG
jgi:hypothetical protein